MTDESVPQKGNLRLSNSSGVYMITCTANGKFYIGSAVCLHTRWSNHKSALRGNRHQNAHLQNAWNKYGERSFKIAILEKCDRDMLAEREQYYLDQWQPFGKRGFNIAFDAKAPSRGRKASPETRAKMSIAHKEKAKDPEYIAKMSAASKGRVLSPEHRAKIGNRTRGRAVSAETRAKISIASKGRPKSPEARAKMIGRSPSPETREKLRVAMKGRIITPEARAKISIANTGRKASDATRAKMSAINRERGRTLESCVKQSATMSIVTYQATSPDGQVFEFKNLKQFCREHNLNHAHMYSIVRGERTVHKGWRVCRVNAPD